MSSIQFSVITGKHKGTLGIVNQICNDWLTAKTPDDKDYLFGGQPISVRFVYFSPFDRKKIVEMEEKGQLGQMFKLYFELNHFKLSGRFRRRKVVHLNDMQDISDFMGMMIPEHAELIKARDRVIAQWCEMKGKTPETMTLADIMEVRALPEWQNPFPDGRDTGGL